MVLVGPARANTPRTLPPPKPWVVFLMEKVRPPSVEIASPAVWWPAKTVVLPGPDNAYMSRILGSDGEPPKGIPLTLKVKLVQLGPDVWAVAVGPVRHKAARASQSRPIRARGKIIGLRNREMEEKNMEKLGLRMCIDRNGS